MAIKDTITKHSFADGIQRLRPNNFSYSGLEALYEYLEQLSEDTREDIEYDPIAFCCEYSEYKDFKELQGDYPDIKDMEDLEANTTVIHIDDESFIIAQF